MVDPRICGADPSGLIFCIAVPAGPAVGSGRSPCPVVDDLFLGVGGCPFAGGPGGGLALACVTGSALYWVLMDFPPRRWGGMSFWGEFGF